VQFDPPAGAFWISELAVASHVRNRGIGAAFLRLAEERARAAGCRQMALSTDIENPARRLYDRCGFRVQATALDVTYERWADSPGRVLMIKDLK
jgi:ribosomal protein S18 acetylase RimI-like enzyme